MRFWCTIQPCKKVGIDYCRALSHCALCIAQRSDYVVRRWQNNLQKGYDRQNSIFLHGKRKPSPEVHLSALNFQSSTFFSRKTRISSIFSGYLHVWACKCCSKIAITRINDLSMSKSIQKVPKSFNIREWPKGFCHPIWPLCIVLSAFIEVN